VILIQVRSNQNHAQMRQFKISHHTIALGDRLPSCFEPEQKNIQSTIAINYKVKPQVTSWKLTRSVKSYL